MLITLPADTWVDLYAATGIGVGTRLILNAYANLVDVSEDATEPPLTTTDKYPLAYHRTLSTELVAGAPGAWGKAALPGTAAIIVVQAG